MKDSRSFTISLIALSSLLLLASCEASGASDWQSQIPRSEPKWTRQDEVATVRRVSAMIGPDIPELRRMAMSSPWSFQRLLAAKVLIELDHDACMDLFFLGDQSTKLACIEHYAQEPAGFDEPMQEHLGDYLADAMQFRWTPRFLVAVATLAEARRWNDPDLQVRVVDGAFGVWSNPAVLDALGRLPGVSDPDGIYEDLAATFARNGDGTLESRGRCQQVLRGMVWYCQHSPMNVSHLLAVSRQYEVNSCENLERITAAEGSPYALVDRYCQSKVSFLPGGGENPLN